MPVRNATTAYGEKCPGPIAALPNTGASPINPAEISAALIPWFRVFLVNFIPNYYKCNDGHIMPVVHMVVACKTVPFYLAILIIG